MLLGVNDAKYWSHGAGDARIKLFDHNVLLQAEASSRQTGGKADKLYEIFALTNKYVETLFLPVINSPLKLMSTFLGEKWICCVSDMMRTYFCVVHDSSSTKSKILRRSKLLSEILVGYHGEHCMPATMYEHGAGEHSQR